MTTFMRLLLALALAVGVLPAGGAPAAAQQPRPVTWCEHPSPKPRWDTQEITVGIGERTDGDATAQSDTSRLSHPVLALILESVAERMRQRTGFAATAGRALPAADHRYTPAVLRTVVSFTLHGDGTIADATAAPYSDTTFANDLIAALGASSEARELLVNGDASTRFDLQLFVDYRRIARAEWRAFTLFAPASLPALVDKKRPAIRYPDMATRWEAEFILQYVVGWDGRARAETIRTVPAMESYRWPNGAERGVFEDFLKHTKYAVAQWTYYPAEIAGCLVDQLVQQKFVFNTR